MNFHYLKSSLSSDSCEVTTIHHQPPRNRNHLRCLLPRSIAKYHLVILSPGPLGTLARANKGRSYSLRRQKSCLEFAHNLRFGC
jgi:hypothetical protein